MHPEVLRGRKSGGVLDGGPSGDLEAQAALGPWEGSWHSEKGIWKEMGKVLTWNLNKMIKSKSLNIL